MHRSIRNKMMILVFVSGLLVACAIFSCSPAQQPIPTPTIKACSTLPASFVEDDLIGTWRASYSLDDKDTIIIKEDGTYKQVYENPGLILVETDWQKWWLERRESGYARLHLEGMRRCELFASLCEREGGGLDPQEYTAIDVCEGGVIEMPHEVVLIVTGSKDDVPRGIILRQTRLAGSEWAWSFQLLEEKEMP